MSAMLLHSSTKQLGTFPLKLYDMLEDAEKHGFDDTISWTPDGTGFKVHRPNDLVEQILPRYFNQQTRYKSFQRQLNMYEFKMLRKATKGTYEEQLKGAFFHPFFVRGKRESCAIIPRKSVSRGGDGHTTAPYFRGRVVLFTVVPDCHDTGDNNNDMGGSFQQEKWQYYHPLLLGGGTSAHNPGGLTSVDTAPPPFYNSPTIQIPSSMDEASTVDKGARRPEFFSRTTVPPAGMISCGDDDVDAEIAPINDIEDHSNNNQRQRSHTLDQYHKSHYFSTTNQFSNGYSPPNTSSNVFTDGEGCRGNTPDSSSKKNNADLFSPLKETNKTFLKVFNNHLAYPKKKNSFTDLCVGVTSVSSTTFVGTEQGSGGFLGTSDAGDKWSDFSLLPDDDDYGDSIMANELSDEHDKNVSCWCTPAMMMKSSRKRSSFLISPHHHDSSTVQEPVLIHQREGDLSKVTRDSMPPSSLCSFPLLSMGSHENTLNGTTFPSSNIATMITKNTYEESNKVSPQLNELQMVPALLPYSQVFRDTISIDESMKGSKTNIGIKALEFGNNDTNPNLSDGWQSRPSWYKEHEDDLLNYAKHIISSTSNHRLVIEVNDLDDWEIKKLDSSHSTQGRYSSDTIGTKMSRDDHDVLEDIIPLFPFQRAATEK